MWFVVLALEFQELSTPAICAYVGKCFGKFLRVWRGGYNRSTGVLHVIITGETHYNTHVRGTRKVVYLPI